MTKSVLNRLKALLLALAFVFAALGLSMFTFRASAAETVIDWSLPYLPDWFASLRNGSSSPLSAAGFLSRAGGGANES